MTTAAIHEDDDEIDEVDAPPVQALPQMYRTAMAPMGESLDAEWKPLVAAVKGLVAFLRVQRAQLASGLGWHVVFRSGTVAHVRDGDPEFAGYDRSEYELPSNAEVPDVDTDTILDDNQAVWEIQREVEGNLGLAFRRAYDALVRQGCPEERCPIGAVRIAEIAGEGALHLVSCSRTPASVTTFNLAFADAAEAAAQAGARLRVCDYMFPEVTAAIAPDMTLWLYDDTGNLTRIK